MEKCECCGDHEADSDLAGDTGHSFGLGGRRYRFECLLNLGLETMCNRIRARRAKAEQPSDTIPAPPPAAPECRECSRPERPIAATHGELCVYCDHSKEGGIHISQTGADAITAAAMLNEETHPGEAAARARMSAADRKATPRATAESLMLALPHPWEMQDD